jgi:hypothetical protein
VLRRPGQAGVEAVDRHHCRRHIGRVDGHDDEIAVRQLVGQADHLPQVAQGGGARRVEPGVKHHRRRSARAGIDPFAFQHDVISLVAAGQQHARRNKLQRLFHHLLRQINACAANARAALPVQLARTLMFYMQACPREHFERRPVYLNDLLLRQRTVLPAARTQSCHARASHLQGDHRQSTGRQSFTKVVEAFPSPRLRRPFAKHPIGAPAA